MRTMTRLFICSLLACMHAGGVYAGKSDPVLGKLTPLRTCFDVKHYDISVKVEPGKKQISGYNQITFLVLSDFREMQLDLAENMQVDSIVMNRKKLVFKRKNNTIVPDLGRKLRAGGVLGLRVYFSGQPHIAELPPWKGGFVWKKDSMGYDWVGLACEGIGASVWLPCKDHWSDEADDGMDMRLTVPKGLTGVSNGRLFDEVDAGDGFRTFHWKTVNTINNYNISINVGKYEVIRDTYHSALIYANAGWTIYPPLSATSGGSTLLLTYYVLAYNKDRALPHFRQVHGMLRAFEHYFGPYPFHEDGYKLVETPYYGMEHQSCIAYGNNYKNNSFGFDFIIIHESGHEWFANSITADDPADMWIHESFTTYSEALYLEYMHNKDTAIEYLEMQKKKIVGKEPMQGSRDVFYHGWTSSDIYYKGTWVLHTIRSICNSIQPDASMPAGSRKDFMPDSLWFHTLRDFCRDYYHRTTNTEETVKYFKVHLELLELINKSAPELNWTVFFNQYIYSDKIPFLDYSVSLNSDGSKTVRYQWKNTLEGFRMPVKIYTGDTSFIYVSPGEHIKELTLKAHEFFKPATELYLIHTP